ncbi:YecA family protein [Romboutsia sp. 1001713B170131_170501_G6]|uniref:YecA family protein n=1 Tax=Romboutsia sp. 1001713B170131_170501_G6 TaxID=2787108 RepID=UPI0018AC2F76|nr:SEC-C domain-containing protein [Romboutsia sp. 1001713B170131_170501_G6]
MLGRNELCPCGSGKKYKKCCLNKDVVMERAERKVSSTQKQYSQLYTRIQEFAKQDKFKEECEKAKEMFYIVEDEATNEKFERFFNTYFIQDHIMENKKVMTVEFYEENRDNLTTQDVEVLRSLFESYVSVYEVTEILEGKIVLKDCLTEREISTEDINLLKDFKVGSCMIARIVEIEGTSILIDVTISISNAVKDVICNDVRYLFNQYEDLYKDMKTFLIHHTHILYKYMQQLLDPSIAEYLKEQKESKMKKVQEEVALTSEEGQEDDCKVCSVLRQNVEAEHIDACVSFWKEYTKTNSDVKGSENGWAAAVEYHIKKNAGESITQAQISKKYEISPSTLGKRYKDLKVS